MGKNANKRKHPKEPVQRLAQTIPHAGKHNPWGQSKLDATPSTGAFPAMLEHNDSTFFAFARGFFISRTGRVSIALVALGLVGIMISQFMRH